MGDANTVTIDGMYPSMVSPFDEAEDIDLRAFAAELDYMRGLGVPGVAVAGSTGEGQSLSIDEAGALWLEAVRRVGADMTVIAGVISTHTRDAIARAKVARDTGADCLMMTPPIYQHPSEPGIVDHYESVWNAVGLPIIIYNVLKHIPVTVETHLKLAEIPGIISIKESTGGEVGTLSDLLLRIDERITVTWANDPEMFLGLSLGAKGSISGICTVMPKHSMQMLEAFRRGDLKTARDIHFKLLPLIRACGTNNWTSATKAALALQGRPVGKARKPFQPLSAAQLRDIELALEHAGPAA